MGGGQDPPLALHGAEAVTIGISLGIGTSLLCLLLGHRFWVKIPHWVLLCGCKNCGGKGKNPVRPEGGGAMSSAICTRCNGTGIDPDTPLPEDWRWRKGDRKRWGNINKGEESQGLVSAAATPTYEELVQIHGEDPTWFDWLSDLLSSWQPAEPQGLLAGSGHRGRRQDQEQVDPSKPAVPEHKRVKQVLAACARCGAPNPSFTEPGGGKGVFGFVGTFLHWILKILMFWRR